MPFGIAELERCGASRGRRQTLGTKQRDRPPTRRRAEPRIGEAHIRYDNGEMLEPGFVREERIGARGGGGRERDALLAKPAVAFDPERVEGSEIEQLQRDGIGAAQLQCGDAHRVAPRVLR